jgi:hypothetical protein
MTCRKAIATHRRWCEARMAVLFGGREAELIPAVKERDQWRHGDIQMYNWRAPW